MDNKAFETGELQKKQRILFDRNVIPKSMGLEVNTHTHCINRPKQIFTIKTVNKINETTIHNEIVYWICIDSVNAADSAYFLNLATNARKYNLESPNGLCNGNRKKKMKRRTEGKFLIISQCYVYTSFDTIRFTCPMPNKLLRKRCRPPSVLYILCV